MTTSKIRTTQKHAETISRIYVEYSKKLTALQEKHRKEMTILLRELEQRKIEELRKKMLQN